MKLCLRDALGNKLEFDQVGSGLGYVLPVLVAVAVAGHMRRTTIIKQPELHLHPVTKALGDVLLNIDSEHRSRDY